MPSVKYGTKLFWGAARNLLPPFIFSFENFTFEIKIHKRIVDLMNATSKTVDALMQLDMPAGVDIEIKT